MLISITRESFYLSRINGKKQTKLNMNSENGCNYITCFCSCRTRLFDAAVNNFFYVLHFPGEAVIYEMNSNWLENKWRSD